MNNPNFLKHIPDDKKEEVYYFYNNIRPNENERIVILDGNRYKDNLKLVNI
jgi:hypothetical protein